jgi:phosphatidylserine decarboxylase
MPLLNDRTIRTFLTLLPKAALSRAIGTATRLPAPRAVHTTAARLFARRYRIEVDEAEHAIGEYPTLASFFTRRLREGSRPVAPGEQVVVSPVDARVAAVGLAEKGRMIQAKGRDYSVAALLDDPVEARAFEGGPYLTLYLSPRDYHRIHAPVAGVVEGYAYIPGKLFPVNPPAVRAIPNLFCVNERLISYLRSPTGRVAVVKVGATCVGRIRAAYDDVVTRRGGGARSMKYGEPIPIEKGAELGVFETGSTVILLFEPESVELDERLIEGARVRMGEAIARTCARSAAQG